MRRLLALLVLTAIGMVIYWKLPPEWNPMALLDLRAEPGPMTRVKLWRLAEDPEACFAAFTASSLALVRVPDRRFEATCMIEDAVLLPNSIMVTPRGPTVTCRMAAAWALFERHSLQRAARQYLGTEIVGVRHLGTYSCRNVNNVSTGRRSEHATANAIDIATFVLANGREVRLARDWGDGKPEGEFLRAIRDDACRWFRVVLSPDYNAAHADHFHFDMGPWRTCR